MYIKYLFKLNAKRDDYNVESNALQVSSAYTTTHAIYQGEYVLLGRIQCHGPVNMTTFLATGVLLLATRACPNSGHIKVSKRIKPHISGEAFNSARYQ